MRTGGQNFTRRRREQSRRHALMDGNWFQVGYMDFKLHCRTAISTPERQAEWQRGFDQAQAEAAFARAQHE